ncbi:porin [Leptospira barantonii]|uniref:Porin n=1 Tax=Leptospira barantonii TaxID=2023184 RepID=A0A5F2AYX4_9LEPT|nr:porin [Leptospira barantonii]TGL93309.1 porin [Leptospira barantonii]
MTQIKNLSRLETVFSIFLIYFLLGVVSVDSQEKKENETIPKTSQEKRSPAPQTQSSKQVKPETMGQPNSVDKDKGRDKNESEDDDEEFQSKDEVEKSEKVLKKSEQSSSKEKKEEDNKHHPVFGFFVDSYYAHNPYRPNSRDNKYLTQPARWDEININLAYIDGKVETDRYRGRVAFQFGNSVNANYKNEVSTGKNSNELSVRNIQEAYAGVKLAKNLWLDGGIYFGNIGLESWISHNNWNYSRALALDYVPYYSSGFRLSYQYSEKLSFQLHLMNGWSNITETNRDKAIGTQIDYKVTDKFKITHNTFIGNEAPDNQPRQTRYYNNIILQYHFTKHFIVAGSGDVGIQRVPNPGVQAYRQWYHATFWITWRPVEEFRTSLRLERMYDPEQTIIQTGTRNGFLTSGATMTFDYIPNENALVRLEGRYFRSYDPVFDRDKSKSKEEKFIVFAVTIKI